MFAESAADRAVATGMFAEPDADRAVATGRLTEPGAGSPIATGRLTKFSTEDVEGMIITASDVRTERIPVSLAVGTLIEVSSATVPTGVIILRSVGAAGAIVCLGVLFR